jgi:hypothetical protein
LLSPLLVGNVAALRAVTLHARRQEFTANHASVADMLVKVVLDVQYNLHETLKKDSEFAR